MYILSLELTKNCNLNCRYCYLGEKPNTSMTFDIATKAIDIGIHEATKQYDKTILTYFIGGEPLLNYEMIRECIFYIEQQCNTNNLQARFSTTINGTLLNEEIIKFFIDKRFEFKVSIDGT